MGSVRVGPLIFRTAAWEWLHPDPAHEAYARMRGWRSPASMPKVLIEPLEPFDRPLTVSGRSCPDGEKLRFGGSWRPEDPEPTREQFARLPDRIDIRPKPARDFATDGWRMSYGGYWNFFQPGIWVIRVHDGNTEIGSFAILVLPPPLPAD